MPTIRVDVSCYAGYRGEETPRRFRIASTWIDVERVVDQWLAPDHRYFKVQAKSGAIYILRHDPQRHSWEMTTYDDTGTSSR